MDVRRYYAAKRANAARRQRVFKARDREGLAVIQVEVDMEVLAATLGRLGYPTLQSRQDLARALQCYLVDLAARHLR
jgi:hypothetical protein